MAESSFETAKSLDDTYVMHTYGRLPVEFVSGEGATLTDSEGKVYIDCLGGIGSVSLGHHHPAVAQALHRQLDKVWQVGNYYYVENRGELARELSELLSKTTDELGHLTGSTGTVWKTFFANSGAEANEGAIKVARRWGEKKLHGASGIITAQKSFHGRTLATLAATGQDSFHSTFLPMPQGFVTVPLNDLDALVKMLDNPDPEVGPICAVMLECVQGEGGVWPADFAYLRSVAYECRKRNVLLIIDEVQTGFFRNGAPFAYQLAGIEPDIVSLAKGIGDGFPMGAVSAVAEVADLMGPGDHGSTFGGNALAAAAGRATVETLVSENIGEHVIETGAHLRAGLEALPHVSEVRGHGLMLGAQFDVPIANQLVEQGLGEGLVLNHIGDSILRFLPPLVISDQQVDEVCTRLAALVNRIA
ncbi:MAG: acetylornithine/succinylornithine family transaminase [Tractidigestivibacter sp.]|jgi:acetylornithine/N-succinyldiaminopimelate aminotransferase|uniref:acetylornithine/succinylornithine family transaminase n=1 Tax=Tractidigestivibacter sp. TaxID=2847320 RepID=UPI003D8E0B21